jgi:hypothetical protein
MRRKFNIDNGLQGQTKEHQAVTEAKSFIGNAKILPRSNSDVN